MMIYEHEFECEACMDLVGELYNGLCETCLGCDYCDYCEKYFDHAEMVGKHCSDCHDISSGLNDSGASISK
jgi:hypothetical protein